MKYIFNNSTAMVYDFIRIILEKYNNVNISDSLNNIEIEIDPNIAQIKNQIWNLSYNTTPGLSLFFKKNSEQNSYISHNYDKKLNEFSSISDFINHFIELSDDELLLNLLDFHDSAAKGYEYYKKLLSDKAAYYEYILSMETLNDNQRIEFLGLNCNRSFIINSLENLFRIIEKEIVKVYSDNNEEIREYERLMKSKVKNNPGEIVSILKLISEGSVPTEKTSEIVLSYSYLNEFLIYTIGEKKPTILLGIHYNDYLKKSGYDNTKISNTNFLKAFSDPTRIDIIRMLNGKEMYVGEITANCKLSFSTTSYHIDILINAGVLLRRMSGRRVYYKLNIDYLAKKLDIIKRSILQNKF